MAQRTRVAAYAWITDGEQVLLTRLGWREKDCAKWTVPGGGIEFGEHPDAAVVREVYEETGLEVVVRRLIGADSECFEYENGAFHAIRFLYDVDVIGGELRAEGNGSTDRVDWFKLTEIDKLKSVPWVDRARRIFNANTSLLRS